MVLFPPRGLSALKPSQPMLGPHYAKRRLAELAATEWEDEPQPSQAITQPTQEERLANRAETITEQEDEPRRESPRPKRRRLDRKDGHGLVKDTPVITDKTTGDRRDNWRSRLCSHRIDHHLGNHLRTTTDYHGPVIARERRLYGRKRGPKVSRHFGYSP